MSDDRLLDRWPTYDDNSLKGDIGVATVKLAVASQLRWAFREKSQIDLGIDGEIEVRDVDKKSRGRVISVQIKCGESFFRSRSDTGFRYRPKPEHLNYWLSHSTPVVLILVDDASRTCYWQHVHPKNLHSVDGVNLIEVPAGQTLSEECSRALKRIADGIQQIDLVQAIFKGWLAESSHFTFKWNNECQTPRDFHGYALWLDDLPFRGVTCADVILGRPEFDHDELDEMLSLAVRNGKYASCDHALIGLASTNKGALLRDKLPQPPKRADAGMTVEYVPLLFLDEGPISLCEVDASGSPLECDVDFLFLSHALEKDREENERICRQNRLWGTL